MISPFFVRCCGIALLVSSPLFAADDYKLGPDSQVRVGVPVGKITQGKWVSEQVFPGTERDYWVYVPAQYDGTQPACVMVFQDGGNYAKADGQFRAPIVFDNLIHKKEMPVTIGVFLNPGNIPAAQPDQKGRSNRSFEYDSLGHQYSKFLIDEVLPALSEKHQLKLTDDPEGRATCGISSGGICAFTVARHSCNCARSAAVFSGSFAARSFFSPTSSRTLNSSTRMSSNHSRSLKSPTRTAPPGPPP